jgi:hypothetical protein
MATEEGPDTPRGRVSELIQVLRQLGLTLAATSIEGDIELRRRAKLRPKAESQAITEEALARISPVAVEPLAEVGTSLSDDEQRALALQAIDLLVSGPMRMIKDVVRISREIGSVSADDKAEIADSDYLPIVQISDARVPVPWVQEGFETQLGDLETAVHELEVWLSEDDTTGGT